MNIVLPPPRELVQARRVFQAIGERARLHETWHSGSRLRWRCWGDGPPLVLLHGGHGSWLHWLRNVEALAERFSVWVPDMPGFGESDVLPGSPHDPQRQVQLVSALDDGLRSLLGRETAFSLAGFSFGGLVAAQLASGHPQVQRLALLGAVGHGGKRRETQAMANWRSMQGRERWLAHAHNLHALMLHDPRAMDAQALLAHTCASHNTRYRSKAISREGRLAEALAGFNGELLLIWGEHDVTAEPELIAAQLQAGRARWHTHIVRDAGHWVQYEKSEQVNALLANG